MIEGPAIDTRGIPSATCLNCGNNLFKVIAEFDEFGDLTAYTTQGYCFVCHAPVTVPDPTSGLYRQLSMEFPDDPTQ